MLKPAGDSFFLNHKKSNIMAKNSDLLNENDVIKGKLEALEEKYQEELDRHKRKEEELKLRLLFFEGIANSTVDGFLVVNPYGQKILQTQRTIELWKMPEEIANEPDGMKQVEHVMHMAVDPQKFMEEIKYQIDHPFEKRLDELELIDGTIMERYSSPVIDANGKNHGRIYTFHDITAQKETEKNLVHLNNQKDRFISVLSHDLRGPVSNLLSISELLSDKIGDLEVEEIKEMIKMINVSAHKTFELLEDTLMWANANLDKLAFTPGMENITEIISEVILILEPMARSKNITLINCVIKDLKANVDVYMLKAILRNLISNAIKFTDNGGRVEISVEENLLKTTVKVTDNGVGIPEETLKKLFNISSLQSTKGTANEQGTGLGLLLCKEFVEKHGGQIWIDSKINNGTTVAFTLPSE